MSCLKYFIRSQVADMSHQQNIGHGPLLMETFQTLCLLMEVQRQIQKLVHNQSLAWIQIIEMLHLYELQCKIPAPLRNEDSIRCVFIGILKAARQL